MFVYTNERISALTDSWGNFLNFFYDNNSLARVESTVGTFYYTYDSKNNLTTVTKPDGSILQYIYDDPKDEHNLTGVVNETGVRSLFVEYDDRDRVVYVAKADRTKEVRIEYAENNIRNILHNSGQKTTYQFEMKKSVFRILSTTGAGCASCSADNTNYTYTSRRQIETKADALGHKTSYTYDTSGNTTTITKAFATPLASTTTKTYGPVTNQIATISKPSVANPGQQTITTMTYDTHENLLTRTQSGFSGTTAITATTTTYTYNSYGQITSIDGPRSDVNDTVNFTYYPNDASAGNNRANLHTVADALGHATTYSDYNAFGQAETLTDPNGIVTTRVFNGSGRMTAATTAGLTTGYAYNLAGQLLGIIRPGGRTISYNYTTAGQVAGIT
ncbi:MAG: hypothetical protein ABIJ50_02705, partial [Pseudomonadota bacterium]